MLLQDYALYTKPIDEMYQQIERWINCRITGAYIYGLSRTGKTKAVKEWFPALLRENYGDRIAVFRCIYKRQGSPSQQGFSRALARGLHHRYSETIKTQDLEWRLAHYFIIRGLRTTLKQVVLFIDEAQYLSESEFHVLCNMQNIAEDASVRLSVIAVGTHQLQQQRQTFIMSHNVHLSARFLAHRSRFRGIRSAAELAHVLDGYDTMSDWPVGSGTPYTKYFFPQAYQNGFRLAHCADSLWNAYLDFAPPSSREKLEVPMEYVAVPIEVLCRSHASEDPAFTVKAQTLRELVKQSNYLTIMREIAGARLIGRESDSG
jgi:hypothetical protein